MKDELKKALNDEALEKVNGGFEILFPEEDYYQACDQEYTCPHCGFYGSGIPMYPMNVWSYGVHQAAYALRCKKCAKDFIGSKDGIARKM